MEIAARESGMSRTAYTELALKDRFKKDGITATKPDFRAHFAKHPPILDGGKALQSLLQDREESV